MRIAVELPPAGDALAGVLAALQADPQLSVTLVGPVPSGFRPDDRVTHADAEVIEALPGEAPVGARQIRARRRWAPRVTAELLAAGTADAAVLTSPPAVAAAALQFTSRLVPGATRPTLVAVLDPRVAGSATVLADTTPGRSGAAPDELAQAALSGVAVAAALGAEINTAATALMQLPPGSADTDRAAAAALLTFAGVVASIRPAADVLTGDVAVGVAEAGTLTSWLSGVSAGAAPDGRVVGARVLTGFPAVVVLPASTSADDVAAAVAVAAAAVRGDLAGRQERSLAALRTRRREAAGLSGATVAFTGASVADPAEPGTKGEEAW